MTITLSNSARKAARTFLQTFIGVFAVTLLGFLAQVTEWASQADAAFPSLSPLGKGAVAATAAGAVALVTYAQNALEVRGTIPTLLPLEKPVETAVDAPAPIVESTPTDGEFTPYVPYTNDDPDADYLETGSDRQ